MSAPAGNTKPAGEAAPESPTTARPLEMDDDDVQETGVLGNAEAPKAATSTATTEEAAEAAEAPPPKPPRPMTEAQKNEQMLKEAFPTVDAAVVKAVLIASGGQIEPAFNALLAMSDPDAVQHEELPPPPQPPRPTGPAAFGPGATPQTQMEADELYARQLAQQYNDGAYGPRTSSRSQGGGGGGGGWPRGRQQTGLRPGDPQERDRSFVDDDLPVIRENLRKGFQETQATVNRWYANLKKRIDESFEDKEHGEGSQGPRGTFMGRPSRDGSRQSADYDRYDADPELLSDDFAGMKFNSDGTPIQNPRPLANLNLFKPPPPPKGTDGRKVSFKEGVEDIDAYDASPKLPPKDTPPPGGAKQSKWQPLSSVDPNPIADNDPFSLGDSEDEKEHKGGIKMEDSERLRAAAAEAMADSLVEDKPAAPAADPVAAKKD